MTKYKKGKLKKRKNEMKREECEELEPLAYSCRTGVASLGPRTNERVSHTLKGGGSSPNVKSVLFVADKDRQ